ncbi:sugar ABC transporter ATP-binding protein [Ruoffia tabacinasalis]|uniref:sugar ABC transporter ATP-binding protein n=1 Tax=Ruoffia tabacinasalis TaxID=87458 RepID=UPI003F964F62
MDNVLLEMKNISKSFPGVKVLKDINLTLRHGEVLALMGENGAGKSTLMKILSGIHQPDSGVIIMNGEEIIQDNAKDAINNGIAMIHQELNPVLDMTVAENIFIGRELKTKKLGINVIDDEQMIEQSKKLLHEIGLEIDPKRKMRTLSIAQIQLLEIVKAISLDAKIIIMDEPTSAITESEVQILFEQIGKLKARGIGIIYISHKMDEIMRIADSVLVMRDGFVTGYDSIGETSQETIIKQMVGRDLDDLFPKISVAIGDTLLDVNGLTSSEAHLHNISFTLKAGEVLGFAGLMGSGRSELMECLFGLTPFEEGEVKIRGEKAHFKKSSEAIEHRVAFITEDRKKTGLNLLGTVKDNVTIISLERMLNGPLINNNLENEAVDTFIEKLAIRVPHRNQIVGRLSGGNQQKVVLAKWLLKNPDIIILDEPTRGIDVGAKQAIYQLINELASSRKGIIVISSELPELMGISDRILVMNHGKLQGEVLRNEFDEEKIMTYATIGGVEDGVK